MTPDRACEMVTTSRQFWVGLLAGCGVTLAVLEVPYLNWHPVVPPIDQRPLVIRQDAKGDGHFQSPRSGNRRHRGIDLAAALNSPVRAIRSGRVVEVGTHRGLGRFVALEHRERLRSLYAHLNHVSVEPGQRIRQGEPIGTVGKTGNARHRWIIPHVHLEVLQHGAPVDPAALGLQIGEPVQTIVSEGGDDARGGE
ncbi:MAG: M23 family metallopeptidase [Candidatus Omnitrophica bacterium]|nr:M23 family metallopeptidase [Candidatus Omnitrophota bacterium]